METRIIVLAGVLIGAFGTLHALGRNGGKPQAAREHDDEWGIGSPFAIDVDYLRSMDSAVRTASNVETRWTVRLVVGGVDRLSLRQVPFEEVCWSDVKWTFGPRHLWRLACG